MAIDNEQPLLSTRKKVHLVSGAFRRSIHRLSSIRGKKPEKSFAESLLETSFAELGKDVVFPEPSDYRIRSTTKDTLIINHSNVPRFGSCRVKPTFTARSQPISTVRCELAAQDNHFTGYTLLRMQSEPATGSRAPTPSEGAGIDAECDNHKITSFEKRRRQNQDYGVALHAKQSLFCPEQASQIEFEILTMTSRDFIVQISAPNGEKSPPLSIQTSSLPARFSPSNVGCGHGAWRLEVFEREQAKFVPRSTKELNLRGCGLLIFEILRSGELRLFDRLWLDVID